MARDKIEGYQQYLREVEETERENKEKIKWETLKRFKMTEHDKAREEEMKAMEMRKKENQRRNLDTQMVRNLRKKTKRNSCPMPNFFFAALTIPVGEMKC